MKTYYVKCRKKPENLNSNIFKIKIVDYLWLTTYKMNEIVNKFLLAGDKFMSEMHLKQPGFTYSACGPFTKNK